MSQELLCYTSNRSVHQPYMLEPSPKLRAMVPDPITFCPSIKLDADPALLKPAKKIAEPES